MLTSIDVGNRDADLIHGGPAPQLSVALQEDINDFNALMQEGVGAVGKMAESSSARFERFARDWMSFGERVDISKPSSAVFVLEQQMKLSTESLRFHFAIETASTTRNAFSTLYKQQA